MKKLLFILCTLCTISAAAQTFSLSLKQPGNDASAIELKADGQHLVAADGQKLPLDITIARTELQGGFSQLTLTLHARERAYYHIGVSLPTEFRTDDCDFYLPGFWYHKNLRSPREAPSFHTSRNWNVREDRLSSPLTAVYDATAKRGVSVLRQLPAQGEDCLTTHSEGEVILSGRTTVGYVGFDGESGKARLTFGFPYEETPRRYIRKLTLAPAITAFACLQPGETQILSWLVRSAEAEDFGTFVSSTWQHCVDRLAPKPLKPRYTAEQVKEQLANYFRMAYVDRYDIKYHSGHTLRCDDCKPFPSAQLGFCGRTILNAFNALEWGEQTGEQLFVDQAHAILDSYLAHGLTEGGYFKDELRLDQPLPADRDIVHSIRQQSEGVYAVFHYLRHERQHGRQHRDWEQALRRLLDRMLQLQKTDGSFPRKYRDDHTDVDASGGSTPSATSALVMAYKYFRDKRYLEAAKRTVDYLEKNIIAPSDYFSSTLDANCEDKEAAISAVTATYYLAMVTKKAERQHYIDLCRRATYFACSWYYLWDVPFAQGQMLGDLGFQSRGWGNVSVENNHVDVFIFELAHIARWLSAQTGEQRFALLADLSESSMNQLLPTPQRLCGIGLPGFYPEVVQHTTWDYGRNGKGFYNDIFAPGWTIASLWELYSPRRTADFLEMK